MSAFDKVIGYESIKNELLQICDMIHNRGIYEELGAKIPHGIFLFGEPGLGKTLMAKSFIDASGLQSYTIRRNKGNDDFIGSITDTFQEAKKAAPCIIFLDDMDKFANEDSRHTDAKEYVAVQSGIDEVKNCDVIIIATANETRKLPSSLLRSGRFDRKINVQCPTDNDANEIIKHYLSGKKIAENINMDDLTKMISYSSCAELETILNEAAINAAYERKANIEMDDLVKSVLRMQYDSPDNYTKISAGNIRKTALHEAGHLVVSEVLCQGSVGLASIRSTGRSSASGFIHRCKELPRKYHILISLAGKAAVELNYSEGCASGCYNDIDKALFIINEDMSMNAAFGLGLFGIPHNISDNMKTRNEAVIYAELERHMFITKDILLKNKEFLEKVTDALVEKETLLNSDISAIRESTTITKVAV